MFIYFTPIISGLIGYVTNAIAVGMLFRPYDDVRLGRIKLFGKGVIPKNHHRLAEKIGITVAEELLSSKDIINKLQSPEVEKLLVNAVKEKLDKFFNTEQPSLFELLPTSFHPGLISTTNKLSSQAYDFIDELLINYETDICAWIDTTIQDLLASGLAEYGAELKKYIINKTVKSYEKFITAGDFNQIIYQKTEEVYYSGILLSELIPPKLNEALSKEMAQLSPLITQKLATYLQDEENKVVLKDKLASAVLKNLQDSNMGMLSMFLKDDFVRDKIYDMYDKGLPDILSYLKTEAMQTKITANIIETYHTYTGRSLKEIIPAESLGEVMGEVGDFLHKYMLADDSIKTLANILDTTIEQTFSQGFSQVDTQHFANKIFGLIKQKISNDKVAICEMINIILNKLLTRPLGKLATWFDKKESGELAEKALTGQIRNIIENGFPSFINAVDIKGIVTEKVEAFPLRKLEKIIKNVAGKELVYITIFGGILGLLIGAVQLLIFLATK